MTCAHGDPFSIQGLANVERLMAREDEGEDRGFLSCRADQGQPRNHFHFFCGVDQQIVLIARDHIHADAFDIIDCRAETDSVGDVPGAGDRLEVVKAIEVQGEMHRYIPILAKNAGFSRIGEQVVEHRARKFGTSKFGMERFLNGFLDLLTISFMSRFARKPMHLFGALGLAMFFLSAVGVGALIINKGISMAAGDPGRNITEISTFYISLTGMVLGGLFFATGFLAEMVSRTDVRRTAYLVSASLGSTEVSDE